MTPTPTREALLQPDGTPTRPWAQFFEAVRAAVQNGEDAAALAAFGEAPQPQVSTSALPAWSNLTLSAGWVNLDSGSNTLAQYRKDAQGRVWVRGTIKNGTTTDGTTIATLPAGYTPASIHRFVVSNSLGSGGAAAKIIVNADGTMTIRGVVTATDLSLDAINFSTD